MSLREFFSQPIVIGPPIPGILYEERETKDYAFIVPVLPLDNDSREIATVFLAGQRVALKCWLNHCRLTIDNEVKWPWTIRRFVWFDTGGGLHLAVDDQLPRRGQDRGSRRSRYPEHRIPGMSNVTFARPEPVIK